MLGTHFLIKGSSLEKKFELSESRGDKFLKILEIKLLNSGKTKKIEWSELPKIYLLFMYILIYSWIFKTNGYLIFLKPNFCMVKISLSLILLIYFLKTFLGK